MIDENNTWDMMLYLLEQFDEVLKLIKINLGEPPGKTAQPQEL